MIHQTAVVSEKAKLGDNVKIGPFCVIGDDVVIGDNSVLRSHVCIDGRVSIGENNDIYPFATIGFQPQDLKYQNEDSEVIIGDHNVIREHVTIHKGTKGGGMKTMLGNNCLIMVGSHIAHDCIVGDNVIMANNATLGGHVVVENHVIIGGLAAVHQHVHIGAHAMIGGVSAVVGNVIPYGVAYGKRAELMGVNIVGMKRRNFSQAEIVVAQKIFDDLFGKNRAQLNFTERLIEVEQKYVNSSVATEIIQFLKSDNTRSMCLPSN